MFQYVQQYVFAFVYITILRCVFSDSLSAADKRPMAWHKLEFSAVMPPCTSTEKMERNVQRAVFLTTHLYRLYVVLIYTPHLDSTAVGHGRTGLILRSAVMDTGDYVCMYLHLSVKILALWKFTVDMIFQSRRHTAVPATCSVWIMGVFSHS